MQEPLRVSNWIQMRHVSDLLPWSRPPPLAEQVSSEGRKGGRGLAAGLLVVFSGIHYSARLKIHQMLPPFQHPAHLNFKASGSQPLARIWGGAWSAVHQGNACAHRRTSARCHRFPNRRVRSIETTKGGTLTRGHFYLFILTLNRERGLRKDAKHSLRLPSRILPKAQFNPQAC